MFFPWGLTSQRWPITDFTGERDYSRPRSLKGERGCFLLSLAGFCTGNRVYFTSPGVSGGAFLMPCSLGRFLFFFSRCSVPGLSGFAVFASVLLCGVAVPPCVTSSCLRCHSSIGIAYMHPRFPAIFSDLSRFSVHRHCLSRSISLFRIFSRFFTLLFLEAFWPVQGRGAGRGVCLSCMGALRSLAPLCLSPAFLGVGCYTYLPSTPAAPGASWWPLA